MADVGITFESTSFKQFNATLKEFENISKRVDSKLQKLGVSISNIDSLVNKLNVSFSSFNSILSRLDGGAIKKLVDSFNDISGSSASKQKIREFSDGFRELMQAFTNKTTGVGAIRSLINRIKGVDALPKTIADLLGKISLIDTNKIDQFSAGIRRIVISFNDIRKLNVPESKIREFSDGFKELLKAFTESSKFGIAGKIYRQITGTQTMFELLGKLDFSVLTKIGDFSSSVKNLSKFFQSIAGFSIDTNAIKNFGSALRSLVKELGSRSIFNRLTLGKFGKSNFFDQLKRIGELKLGNFSNFSSAISRLVTSLDKINRIKVDANQTRLIAEQFRELAKISVESFNTGSRLSSITNIFKVGLNLGKSLVDGFKKALGISSPSKVFMELGKNSIQGFAKGVTGALGLVRSAFSTVVNAAKKIVSPITGVFSFIKQHFVLTFADLQRIARSTFQAVIGTTIEFESAFTGVLKTLDTSQIFAQTGEEGVSAFIDQLRSDLIGLSRDADSMTAGLENSFVRLSSIAEAAGQLGVAAQDVVGFTDVIGQLSIATDLADEEAAFFLAKFTSITGDQSVENFQQLGGTIVNLGNNLAVTESQIAEVSQRIVAAGTSAGLSQDQILAWSAAIRASGLNAEAGSTSFIQFSNAVTEAIAGGDLNEIEEFSDLIGVTAEQFEELYDTDPNQLFIDLLENLGKLNRTELVTLEEQLGLDGIRLDQFVASMGAAQSNSQVLTRAMALASDGMEEFGDTTEDFNALQEETSRRVETTEFKVNRMKNAWLSLSNTVGTVIQPVFNSFVDTITNIILGIEGFINKISTISTISDALGLSEEVVTRQRSYNEYLEDANNSLRQLGDLSSGQLTTTGFIEHQFELGDTLSALADKYGITVQDILDFNNKTLEDFAGGLSSVRIPIQTFYAATGEDIDITQLGSVTQMGVQGGPFGAGFGPSSSPKGPKAMQDAFDHINEQVELLKTNLGDVGDGLREVFSGDVSTGIDTIANSLGDVKDNARDALDTFLTAKGVDVEGLNFAEVLIETFDQLFGVDLTPVYEFVSDHYIDILAVAFGFLTGSSVTLAIPVARTIVDILDTNSGDIEGELKESAFLSNLLAGLGNISNIVVEGIGSIFDIFKGGPDVAGISTQLLGQRAIDEGALTDQLQTLTFGDKLKEAIKIAFGSLGQITGELAITFAGFIIEIIKNLPDIASDIYTYVVVPFISSLFEQITSEENKQRIREGINSLFEGFGIDVASIKESIELIVIELRLMFEDVKGLVGQRDEELTTSLENQKALLEARHALREELEAGTADISDLFPFIQEGDITSIITTPGAFDELNRIISEEVGLDTTTIIENFQDSIGEIATGLQAEDIDFSEAYSALFAEGLTPLQIRTLLTEQWGASEQDVADAFVEVFGNMDLSSVSSEIMSQILSGLQGVSILQDVGQVEFTEEQLAEFAMMGQELSFGISQGIDEGVNSEEFIETMNTAATTIENIMRNALETQSPSQLTARIGRDLLLGLNQGLNNNIPLLTPTIDNLVAEIGRIGGAAYNAHNDIAGLEGALQSLAGIGFSVNITGSGFGGRRRQGGNVIAGKIYEVLEPNLPFELFRTNNQTFMIPNRDGEVLSPAGNMITGGNNVSNAVTYQITVPVTFETVPTDVSAATLNGIANRIATTVEGRINQGMRESTLQDRATRAGVV